MYGGDGGAGACGEKTKNRQKPPKTAKKRLTSMFGEFSSVVEGAIAQASILVGFENFRFF